MSGSGRGPSQMSGSGRKALVDVREARPDVRESLGGPSVCPVVVGRPSRRSGCGREALKNVREWSGGPHGCPGEVGSFSRMSARPSRMSGRLVRMSGSVWEALPYVQ